MCCERAEAAGVKRNRHERNAGLKKSRYCTLFRLRTRHRPAPTGVGRSHESQFGGGVGYASRSFYLKPV